MPSDIKAASTPIELLSVKPGPFIKVAELNEHIESWFKRDEDGEIVGVTLEVEGVTYVIPALRRV